MRFKIDKKIFEAFPGLNIGLVIVKGIDNTGSDEDVLTLLKSQQEKIRTGFDKETLSQYPQLESWRKAYSSFGAKPKKYKCSVENLYRMILDGIEINHINKVVDIYNYISLKHTLPLGGDDTDKIDGGITLRFARGDESFVQLNSEETKNPKEGEIIYADDKEVLCRRWNWRECDKSKMTEETKNVALVVEGIPPVTREEIQGIIDELSALVKKFCGGDITTHILDRSNHEVDI